MIEKWTPIEEIQGSYSVSNTGKVRRNSTGKLLKVQYVCKEKYGTRYPVVHMTYRGHNVNKSVTRLVAQYYMEDYNDNIQVELIDPTKPPSIDNIQHRKDKYGNHVQKVKKILCVETRETFESLADLSKSLGVDKAILSYHISVRTPYHGKTYVNLI